MSSQIDTLMRRLDAIEAKAKPQVQASLIQSLLQQVADYATNIEEEKKLVRDIDNLRSLVRKAPETPEEEDEHRKVQDAFERAKNAERNITAKRADLRRLETSVQELLSLIRRANNS